MPTAYGSIGTQRGATAGSAGRPGSLTYGPRSSAIGISPAIRLGTLRLPETVMSGSTAVLGTAVANHRVYVYDRNTGRLVRSARSDASGNFAINGLAIASDRYFAVSVQESTDTGTFNLKAFDHLSQA